MKLTKTILSLVLLVVAMQVMARETRIIVKAGDAGSLLSAIGQANQQNADPQSERVFILIPDGLYDLGERALTPILGYNIALVGQSMEKTIIKNAPPVEKEGIGTTATLLNRGKGTYVQDLTLQNALDYYHAGSAGRAVCWQDKGNRTIFKRVRMLSYQDTYYSHSEECQHYFEDSEIHGTVDFICGAGDVFFNRCLIVTEDHNPDGTGLDIIVAPRTSTTCWGYVFKGCTIRSKRSNYYLARGWHTLPRCTWIDTRIENPEKLRKERFDPRGMRTVESLFYEYNTTDAHGRGITPQSNVVTFTLKGQQRSHETILPKEELWRFSVEQMFSNWRPEKITKKLSQQAERLKKEAFR